MTICAAIFLITCARENPPLVKTKVFALSPQDYTGTKSRVQGRVAASGPGAAYFLLEDESGSVVVTTESIAQKMRCPVGSNATLQGVLRQIPDGLIGNGPKLYFSMENIVDCSP